LTPENEHERQLIVLRKAAGAKIVQCITCETVTSNCEVTFVTVAMNTEQRSV